jgi:hypothetical protein
MFLRYLTENNVPPPTAKRIQSTGFGLCLKGLPPFSSPVLASARPTIVMTVMATTHKHPHIVTNIFLIFIPFQLVAMEN